MCFPELASPRSTIGAFSFTSFSSRRQARLVSGSNIGPPSRAVLTILTPPHYAFQPGILADPGSRLCVGIVALCQNKAPLGGSRTLLSVLASLQKLEDTSAQRLKLRLRAHGASHTTYRNARLESNAFSAGKISERKPLPQPLFRGAALCDKPEN